ncbi:uncharacterized protein LOC144743102 [Ciona intestinalis]
MFNLGQSPLSLETAALYLKNKSIPVFNKPRVKAKGGEGYLFQALEREFQSQYQSDEYNFTNRGTNRYGGICKRYFRIKHPNRKGVFLDGFQRHVYSTCEAENSETDIPVYLIHYFGDEAPYQDDVNEDVVDGALQKKILKKVEIARTYDFMRMAENCVRRFMLGPDIVVHFASPQILEKTSEILELSIKQKQLKQIVSYTTIFCTGADLYVSVLGCRNLMLDNPKMFPFAFMIHDKNYTNYHREFLHDVLIAVGFQNATNVPFLTNRNQEITKAFQAVFPMLSNVYCVKNVIKDIGRCAKSFHLSNDVEDLKNDIYKLARAANEQVFLQNLDVVCTLWPKKFKLYFDQNIREDLLYHCCDFVTRKFPAFVDDAVAEDTLKSLDAFVRSSIGNDKLLLNELVEVLIKVQKDCLNEFTGAVRQNRGSRLKRKLDHDDEPQSAKRQLVMTPKTKGNIAEEVQQRQELNIQPCQKAKNAKLLERCYNSKYSMAKRCVRDGLIEFIEDSNIFTVLSFDQETVCHVQNFPKAAVCSCGNIQKCYHILAVEMVVNE